MNSLSRNLIIIGGIVIFLLLTGLYAWHKKSLSTSASGAIPANCDPEVDRINPLPDGEMEKEKQEGQAEVAKVTGLLNQENFLQLDQYGHQLRSNMIRFSYGEPKLDLFYRTLSYPATGKPGEATLEEWQSHIRRLKQWMEGNPGSITARVSLACALLNYSNIGKSYSMEEDIIEARTKRTAEVAQILEEAGQLPEKCPHWYYAMLDIAYVKMWDGDSYNQLFNEATDFAPRYDALYRAKVHYIKKYVGDGQGAVARYADEVLAKLGGNDGRRMYYLIAAAGAGIYGTDVFNQTELDWEKVIAGYNASNELYGECATRLNFFCYLATAARDADTVRKAMKRLGDNINTGVWSTKYYGQIKDWAFRPCRN